MIFSHFPKNNKTKTSFMQKIFLFAFGLFLCAILLESGLRMGGFIFLSFQEHRNAVSVRQKGAYRILCLGESTTANTWPAILEDILNQKNIGIRFSVIDKGRIGTNTSAILSKVGSYLDEYHPDAVVAMMGCNDRRTMYYQDIPESDTWLFRHCRAYRFSRIIYMHILKKIKKEGIYGLNRLDSGRKAKLENTGTVAEKTNLAAPEKSKNYVYVNDSTCPFTLEDINMETVIADPYAGLGAMDKSLDKKIEESYLKAIEMHPKNQKLYSCLATFYEGRQMYDKAEKTHLRGMEVNPEDYVGYFALGLMYEHLGNNDKAEEIYKKTIEVNSRADIRAYYSLSSLYCLKGQYNKAEEVLKKGIVIDPFNDVLYGSLALLYEKQNKHSLVKEYFVKADSIRLRSNNPQTQYNYQKLQEILKQRNVKLVLVQYPLRSIKYLKKMVDDRDGIVFVDNELIFKKVLKTSGYKDYFIDRFAGDFGHCTERGYELLARNIADTILKDVFKKP